jgi:hypothetical protein
VLFFTACHHIAPAVHPYHRCANDVNKDENKAPLRCYPTRTAAAESATCAPRARGGLLLASTDEGGLRCPSPSTAIPPAKVLGTLAQEDERGQLQDRTGKDGSQLVYSCDVFPNLVLFNYSGCIVVDQTLISFQLFWMYLVLTIQYMIMMDLLKFM